MTETDVNETIAELIAEAKRLELENRKRAAETTRDVMQYMKRQGSARRRPNALAEWFPTLLAGVMGFGMLGAATLVVIAARREHHRWEAFVKAHNCHIVERNTGRSVLRLELLMNLDEFHVRRPMREVQCILRRSIATVSPCK